ncbi:hypothetical protein LOC68_27730 [Blastopirellula sp. JC732]|uniref:Uncharacterized protein n=1 Tax=Blastopirellula sediminis TaxID=2894196 RepID=A0A9X1SJ18_9BACT|nr:hypothetical protein [Blastopirellula sediminis]MCC9604498.1 hypothetical protein [Blastopirellula sediminis]MCC9632203.1 hypothetical protein [Blastopirellula sediminis]
MLRSLLFGLVAVVGACAVSSQADAFFPGCFGPRVGYSGFGITNFGGYGGFGYYGDNIPSPPYYAIHPPVYYSYPVARPYGVSPFAIGAYQPSQRFVYQAPTPEPQVVMNPYVSTEVPVATDAPAEVAPADSPSDEGAGEEGLTDEPAAEEAAPAANETTASPWPTPLVVINPFVDSNEVVPVSFTKIVTP